MGAGCRKPKRQARHFAHAPRQNSHEAGSADRTDPIAGSQKRAQASRARLLRPVDATQSSDNQSQQTPGAAGVSRGQSAPAAVAANLRLRPIGQIDHVTKSHPSQLHSLAGRWCHRVLSLQIRDETHVWFASRFSAEPPSIAEPLEHSNFAQHGVTAVPGKRVSCHGSAVVGSGSDFGSLCGTAEVGFSVAPSRSHTPLSLLGSPEVQRSTQGTAPVRLGRSHAPTLACLACPCSRARTQASLGRSHIIFAILLHRLPFFPAGIQSIASLVCIPTHQIASVQLAAFSSLGTDASAAAHFSSSNAQSRTAMQSLLRT
ncbi:hypothetical protein L1887_51582 [Cichorium endivia]|nr:hypothetical protein L1887_51582 [Cichorium endivia]